MELKGRIEAEFTLTSEESAAILQGMLDAGMTTPRIPVKETAPENIQAPVPEPKKKPAPVSKGAEEPAPQPAPAAPEAKSAPAAAPVSDYKETPEQAVQLLKEQFHIDKPKEERNAEEQKKAVALNRAILTLIRDITRDGSAQSLADLGCDLNRQEFIRRSMKFTYDVGTNKFEETAF